jgi:histone deacetylase 1/2
MPSSMQPEAGPSTPCAIPTSVPPMQLDFSTLSSPLPAGQPLSSSPSPSPAGPSPSLSPSPSPAAPLTSTALVLRPHTCSHSGIFRPKERTDGTVAWHTACVTADVANPSSEPRTYQAAMSIPHWREAMEQEYHALLRNETWTLVPPPP